MYNITILNTYSSKAKIYYFCKIIVYMLYLKCYTVYLNIKSSEKIVCIVKV